MVFGYIGRALTFSAKVLQFRGEVFDAIHHANNAGNWIMRQGGIDPYHNHPDHITERDIETEVSRVIWDIKAPKKFNSITGLVNTQYACLYNSTDYAVEKASNGSTCNLSWFHLPPA